MTQLESPCRHFDVEVLDIHKWLRAIVKLQLLSSRVKRVGCFLDYDVSWIYRGQANKNWELSSSFIRMVKHSGAGVLHKSQLRRIEAQMMDAFKHHASLIGIVDAKDELEWLSYMQHYGCPTRLIDFTEVPLVALYHAVYCDNEVAERSPFVIYMLASDYILGTECYSGPYQDGVEQICNKTNDPEWDKKNARDYANWCINPNGKRPDENTNAKIICVYPTFANRRMEAQSGLFLMQRDLDANFENDVRSLMGCKEPERCSIGSFLKVLDDEKSYNELRFVKFVFPSKLRREAKCLLTVAGITHRAMFPDFEGLAQDVAAQCSIVVEDLTKKNIDSTSIVMPLHVERANT